MSRKGIKLGTKVYSEETLEYLIGLLPNIFSIQHLTDITGGLLSLKMIRHAERMGLGPIGHRWGSTTFFLKPEFAEWVRLYYGGIYYGKPDGHGYRVGLSQTAKEQLGRYRQRAQGEGRRPQEEHPSGDELSGDEVVQP